MSNSAELAVWDAQPGGSPAKKEAEVLKLFLNRVEQVGRAAKQAGDQVRTAIDWQTKELSQSFQWAVAGQTDAQWAMHKALVEQVLGVQAVLGRIAGEVAEARIAQQTQIAAQKRTADAVERLLALQQAVLNRDHVQQNIEEFLFQLARLIRQVETPPDDADPVAHFYSLEAVLGRVRDEGIDTPMIRGVANKELFDGCLTRARTAHARLRETREVQDALAWGREQVRLAEEEQRRAMQRKAEEVEALKAEVARRVEEARRAAEDRQAAEDRRRAEERRAHLKKEEQHLRRRKGHLLNELDEQLRRDYPHPLPSESMVWLTVIGFCCVGPLGVGIVGLAGQPSWQFHVQLLWTLVCLLLPVGCFALLSVRRERTIAQRKRVAVELLDTFDLLTLSRSGSAVSAVAAAFCRGERAVVSADQVERFTRLVAEQPWAELDPAELPRRGLDTSAGVQAELERVARRVGREVVFPPG